VIGGFDYFDGNHRENFCAALILLCLDEDRNFRQRFSELVRDRFRLPNSAALTDWGREVSLDIESGNTRRSDLWLKFGAVRVLMEIKTHSGWHSGHVHRQLIDQAASQVRGQQIDGVAILAPTSLLDCLRSEHIRKLSWREILDLVETIEQPSRILSLAQAQWRCNVEADFGLAGPTTVTLNTMLQLVSQVGCLAAFLRDTLSHVGGTARGGTLHVSRPDGQPLRSDGWGWFALAVPGQLAGDAVLIGIYSYVECPTGSESARGTWLEMYRKDDYAAPIVSIRFEPPDLTHASLVKIQDEFVAKFGVSRTVQTVATVGG
jgi:hypothetical protein